MAKNKKYSQKQLKTIQDKLGLRRLPTQKEVAGLIKLKDKIGKPLTKENIREYYQAQKNKPREGMKEKTLNTSEMARLDGQLTELGYSEKEIKNYKIRNKISFGGKKPDNIYEDRDDFLDNYLGALGEQFDEATRLQLDKYADTQKDLDTDIEYYREDFEKITSRKNEDYYKGMALQNTDFSKSLDYVSNLSNRMAGALEGFGKSRIVEATEAKLESDRRYKLQYDRSMQDLETQKDRREARYKLGTTRLRKSEKQFEKERDVEKKVMGIEVTGEVTKYYDQLVTGKTLEEEDMAKRRKNIVGGGTGLDKIFNY